MKAKEIGMSVLTRLLLFLLPIPVLTQFIDGECGIPSNSSLSPWIAFLHTTDLIFVCSGTLITHKLILTAAHCIEANSELIVRLGEFGGSREEHRPPEEHHVKYVYNHPFYDMDTNANDIAILELVTYVIYTDNIRPICILWHPSWKRYVDTIQVLTGLVWGKRKNENDTDKYRTVDIRRQPPEMCVTSLGMIFTSQICAGNPESNLCNPDCSSPLGSFIMHKNLYRFVQIGIATTNQRCNKPSIYTDVFSHIEFILRVWRQYGRDQSPPIPIQTTTTSAPSFGVPKMSLENDDIVEEINIYQPSLPIIGN